ncbi:PilZ domain-containing protein [Lysobacter solisilvae]|uniref:PilZ domain-containing protein n=1 Tax=Agrilutibacter solisilvae TaxID=2763317 RepID=A0A974Y2I3_9GAMM|nr:PilZ domain-containing protein [Lysobacter solisilvae]
MVGSAPTASQAAAHEALFGDALACDEVRPAAFLTGSTSGARLRVDAANGEALLRALAIVEDGLRSEEPEPGSDNTMHRLEAKLDLLTSLVAGLVPAQDTLALLPLRWSARGACLRVDTPVPAGSVGTLRVQPVDWLPSTLVLPVRVLACELVDGLWQLWLRFDSLPPALEAALERHLFRIHRRAIAETRRR